MPQTEYERFCLWLKQRHPGIELKDWQDQALQLLLGQPNGAGKSFVIKLLAEYNYFVPVSAVKMQEARVQLGDVLNAGFVRQNDVHSGEQAAQLRARKLAVVIRERYETDHDQPKRTLPLAELATALGCSPRETARILREEFSLRTESRPGGRVVRGIWARKE